MNINNAFSKALGLARFFFRSPQDKAVENLAGSTQKLITAIVSLPVFAEWEGDFEAFATAYGWGVTRNPDTGHIETLQQPAGTWVMGHGGGYQFQPAGESS